MPGLVQPARGMVLHLDEPQYRFGTGPLICRVTDVLGLLDLDGSPWWHVRGECALGTRANHGGRHARELYVTSTAVQPVTRRD